MEHDQPVEGHKNLGCSHVMKTGAERDSLSAGSESEARGADSGAGQTSRSHCQRYPGLFTLIGLVGTG